MPIYEYQCYVDECLHITEVIKPTRERFECPKCPKCKAPTRFIISASTMHSWDNSRKFPNLSPHGDGTKTFESKHEYKQFLAENHVGEFSTDAPVKTPHGATVEKF